MLRSRLQRIRRCCAIDNEKCEKMSAFDMAREYGYWPLIEPFIDNARHEGYGSTIYKVNNDGLLDDVNSVERINTYPFGRPTTDIFDKMFVVCAGKTKLVDCFDAIDKHCKELVRLGSSEQDSRGRTRSVVMITDKWDTELFRENFEKDFVDFAIDENIIFLFYLVNDYGCTNIPFIPFYLMHELQRDPHINRMCCNDSE